MNIILMSKFCKKSGSIEICLSRLFIGVVSAFIITVSLALYTGYEWGKHNGSPQTMAFKQQISEIIRSENHELSELKQSVIADVSALSQRMGLMQADMLRVEALGERLIVASGMERGEFDFSQDSPVGGIDDSYSDSVSVKELVQDFDQFQVQLEDKHQKLLFLEELFLSEAVENRVVPSMKPLNGGWISARYGNRRDPFNGSKKFHHGIDFAGKAGSEIYAVAAGVVSRSEKAGGYGNLVEINHGNGYVSRYAHNKKNIVAAGDIVEKGQLVALLGSTGRSTGPHLHFEVIREGKKVNPKKYLK